MNYTIKEIDVESNSKLLMEAYYAFFEYLYGKSPISFVIHKRINQGKQVPSTFKTLDTNFGYALEVLNQAMTEPDIAFIGAIDEKELLTSISRIRKINTQNGEYICISEIIPIIKSDPHMIFKVTMAIDEYILKNKSGDFITFEVPAQDIDFQDAVFNLGYRISSKNSMYPTVLYDKPLEKNISLQ